VNGINEELVLECSQLKQGSYILYIEVEWINSELINSFILSVFTDQSISLEAAVILSDKNEYF